MDWQLTRTYSSTVLDRMNALRLEYQREHDSSTMRGAGVAFLLTLDAYDRLLGEVAMLMGPAIFRREDWRQGSDFYFGIPIYHAPRRSRADDVRLMPESEAREWLSQA